jgi:hypothetical protein
MLAREWYGSDPSWTRNFDRQALEDFGNRLQVSRSFVPVAVGDPASMRLECGGVAPNGTVLPKGQVVEPRLFYSVSGVEVQARVEPVEVTVLFERQRHFGGLRLVDGRDFPAVYAGEYDESPHRYSDGSLCLYYPLDPESRRWTFGNGLRSLISLAADHLFFEDWHRQTGEWIAPEAPHGFPAGRSRAA